MFTKGTFTLSNKWDMRYLALAEHVSTWSKDPSTKIGSIAVGSNGQVLAQGYNGFPRLIEDDLDLYSNREEKYKRVVHAEMNVIYNASYNGTSLKDSTLYVNGLPVCSECAKGVIQVGIKKVIMKKITIPDKWRPSWSLTQDLFKQAGVDWEFIE